jgi:glutamate N-acetyltransferase/amino-acid N-acetyltransferase
MMLLPTFPLIEQQSPTMATATSPLAPEKFPGLPTIDGVRLGVAACGVRYQGRTDLLVAELSPGTTIAGVFTKSTAISAPAQWCRASVKKGKARAFIDNSGNANAFTGKAGEASVKRTVTAAAKLLGCKPSEVFVASTGIIGVPLPDEKITAALPSVLKQGMTASWEQAARAIMTTDTYPKGSTRTVEIGGVPVKIAGIAKGSGMIAPNMGTMHVFIATDAKIPAKVLQPLVKASADKSFNCITVDSDTSTSDTVLLAATGQVKHKAVKAPGDAHLKSFRAALDAVMLDLAHQVVKDGEGATKFVEIRVTGAANAGSAKRLGLAVANSPLVKTAIAGEDANWGRIVAAIGKAVEPCDMNRIVIAIGGVPITAKGMMRPDYDETPVARHMKGQNILIEIDAGLRKNGKPSPGRATVWTCDLTHAYIDINIGYRS